MGKVKSKTPRTPAIPKKLQGIKRLCSPFRASIIPVPGVGADVSEVPQTNLISAHGEFLAYRDS